MLSQLVVVSGWGNR